MAEKPSSRKTGQAASAKFASPSSKVRTTVGTACDGPDTDLCTEGALACDASGGVSCTDATGDSVETCNGMDDDCDEAIDEARGLARPPEERGRAMFADRAMLEYVDKLTRRPWEMAPSDVARLREAGFSDAAVLDINQVAAYYAYVNRLADGLGVELEPERRETR